MIMNYKQHQKELEKLFKKMSDKQMRQYFTLLALFDISYFPDDFWERTNKENAKYLSRLAYLVVIAIIINFNYNHARTRVLTHDLDLARAIVLDLNLARDRDLNLARAIARDLDLALDFAHVRARALDHALAHDRDLNLALTRTRNLDLARARDLSLEISKFILAGADFDLVCNQITEEEFEIHADNSFLKFAKYFNRLPDRLNRFLHSLYKSDRNPRISVWADLFEKMFKHNLKLEENEIEAILALEKKDIFVTVAESSDVLYGYLYSGISEKYEMRLIILGEKGHGKTAFRSRFVKLDGHFPDKEATTEGVDFEEYTIPDSEKEVTIKFWDFAGDSVTHEAHKYFLSERAVYVIVYDSRQEEQGQLSKWLEHIKDFAEISKGRKPQIFILVNLMRDTTTGANVKVSINENQLKQNYKNHFELEFDYMNLLHDNQEGGRIAQYRQKIEDYILSLDTKVPGDYVKIYDKIQAEESNSFIDVSKVSRIIRNVMGHYSDETLKMLHKYAFFFYFKGSESQNNQRVILNPEWITHAIYKIIRFAHDKDGVIERSDILSALKIDDKENLERDRQFTYGRESMKWIENTLVHFQIAYRNDGKLVFPMCLKTQYDGENTTLEFDEKDSFQTYFFIPMKGTDMRQQFPKDIVSSVIINNHEHLSKSNDGKFTLATRTYARFENRKAKVEIVRVDDYMLYILGKGSDFKSSSLIVMEYAEKLHKYLRENYSRFERDMPGITVAYNKDTEQGVSIDAVCQSIIEKIQKGMDVEKEFTIHNMIEEMYYRGMRIENDVTNIKRDTSEIRTILSGEVLRKFKELHDEFLKFKECMKEDSEVIDEIQMRLDSFVLSAKENDIKKARWSLNNISKFVGKAMASAIIGSAVKAALEKVPALLPAIEELIRLLGSLIMI
jgi:GTPase SAR1 family protein